MTVYQSDRICRFGPAGIRTLLGSEYLYGVPVIKLQKVSAACRVEDQWGVRHLAVERRLLDIDPRLKLVILGMQRDGLKTEPAFAQALQLDGDPYEALLDLDTKQDSELAMLVEAARNSGNVTLN